MKIDTFLQGRNRPAYEGMDLLSRSGIGSVSGIKSETELCEVGCNYIYSCTWRLSLGEALKLGLPPQVAKICKLLGRSKGWHLSPPPSWSEVWGIIARSPHTIKRAGLIPSKAGKTSFWGKTYTIWRASFEAPYWGVGESPASRIFGRGPGEKVEIYYLCPSKK